MKKAAVKKKAVKAPVTRKYIPAATVITSAQKMTRANYLKMQGKKATSVDQKTRGYYITSAMKPRWVPAERFEKQYKLV